MRSTIRTSGVFVGKYHALVFALYATHPDLSSRFLSDFLTKQRKYPLWGEIPVQLMPRLTPVENSKNSLPSLNSLRKYQQSVAEERENQTCPKNESATNRNGDRYRIQFLPCMPVNNHGKRQQIQQQHAATNQCGCEVPQKWQALWIGCFGLCTALCAIVIYHCVSDEMETSSAEEQLVRG